MSVSFTVSVLDIHDETPTFSSPVNMDVIDVDENDGTGTPVTIPITGSDDDALTETYTFTLTTNPGGMFTSYHVLKYRF